MALPAILITVIATLTAFAKDLGSWLWAFCAKGSIAKLLDDIGRIIDKKMAERKEPFLNKTEKELTPKEKDHANWIFFHVNSEGLTEALRLYKCSMGRKMALFSLAGFCAISLSIEGMRHFSYDSYWYLAPFLCIFWAVVCAGAWDRCCQCCLRVPEACRILDEMKIMRGLERQGKLEKIVFDEEQPEIHMEGGEGVQAVWRVRNLALERAINYILYGSG